VIAARSAHDVAERAAREHYGRLLAYLAARCGDVHAAEDALSDAFAAALERWPADGVPRAPAAWLLVAARNRLYDHVRRLQRTERLQTRLAAAGHDAERDVERGGDIADERLALMFACAHPALGRDVRAPLMLQVVLGLDAARIASAFLVRPEAMSQRLVRAKRKIADAGIPLRVPEANELPERLDAVLAAIYAAFAEAWDDPAGADPRTRGLAAEALWLGRMVVEACPDEPEALGLLALMLHADARKDARRNASGAYVPLGEQDVARWDAGEIAEAEALLERASRARRIGRFQLEAAIQSAHAAGRRRRAPDWRSIVVLYDELLRLTASPVVALNRAVAIGWAYGASRGLGALAAIAADPRLEQYQPYWAARADLLSRAGDAPAARAAYSRAIGLTVEPAVRDYLTRRMESVTRAKGARA
jgi:RNA polymerase sigma-70 factor (ECF subfamily)